MIPFNKPYLTGKETEYISQVLSSGKIAGDGPFTRKCQLFFEQALKFRKALLTTSCTDALELASLLIHVQPGDEVIVPSYTFVSTANPFVLRGAKIVFADSCEDNPNIDADKIEPLITKKTRAIVPVHYAGIACDMDKIMALAKANNIKVIEDAAHAIDSFYKSRPLGSISDLGVFSFHETKNIISGEGGMLTINDESLIENAVVMREKGTNRTAFLRGETDKYSWVSEGSSYLPSELIAAFLFAQLEDLNSIQEKRKKIWQRYMNNLQSLNEKEIGLPQIPAYATQNGSIFYLICRSARERNELITYLKEQGIQSVFHYLPLHLSPYYKRQNAHKKVLANAERMGDSLVRLPLYPSLTELETDKICEAVINFYNKK